MTDNLFSVGLFSVGDEVVCVDASVYSDDHTLIKDATYVVIDVGDGGMLAVEDENGDRPHWVSSASTHFYPNRFRLIKSKIGTTSIENNKNWGMF